VSIPTLQTGILAKQDIEALINDGKLISNADLGRLEPCSYDMRVGTIFYEGQVINGAHSQADAQIIVQPGEIISLFTEEELHLPLNIAATAFAINEMSSKGLLVLNPGHIDPGFEGPLTVKALNMRKVPLAITRGQAIFTVIFECMPTSTNKKYSGNKSRADREREFNARDVETAPGTLANLVILGTDAPFPNRQEVREMIALAPFVNEQKVKELIGEHWMSRWTLVFTIVAAIASIVAVIIGAAALYVAYPKPVVVRDNNSVSQPPTALGQATESTVGTATSKPTAAGPAADSSGGTAASKTKIKIPK